MLWREQIDARHELEAATITALDVYGHKDTRSDTGSSIREKDKFLRDAYKSEHAQNAGAYARLKFAMDYWCALWFWPISQADLLPSRADFIFEMDLILRGTMQTSTTQTQTTLIDTETEDEVLIQNVDLDQLCELFPRLALVRKIANDNKFMHWELEFADVFADKGGFDLVIGNPPWLPVQWAEQGVLSDKNPIYAVKGYDATQTGKQRHIELEDKTTYMIYFNEYESISGQQNFFNAVENYPVLKGSAPNLYKCFIPQAWQFGSLTGVSAFVHPDGVYDDPKGGLLRTHIYPKLKYHFQFTNELKLFAEVDHHTGYSLNVYNNKENSEFESISNLFAVETIEQCYDSSITGNIPGIKDENGKWNIHGHPGRVVHVGQKELELFAKLLDGSEQWEQSKLPVIHAQILVDVLRCFYFQKQSVDDLMSEYSFMIPDTSSKMNGIISDQTIFPSTPNEVVYLGPNIGNGNPIFKATRRICKHNSDYDIIDLSEINDNYIQRCGRTILENREDFIKRFPQTDDQKSYANTYRVIARKMLNQSGERTLISSLIFPGTSHIDGLISIHMRDLETTALTTGLWTSLPFDYMIKTMGKDNFTYDNAGKLPLVSIHKTNIIIRALLLNAMNVYYKKIWEKCFCNEFTEETWSKSDPRLDNKRFSTLTSEWTWDTPLRTDYERRQALVEIDVLTAMALGMTLEQLKTIYRIQFPVLQQYEADTWYDANGRIVFTTNRSLVGVGFDRKEWEGNVKGAPAGKVFTREIEDDTMPGGPVKRTIEYVAPFDKCDREQDYETAWRFFEEKYGK